MLAKLGLDDSALQCGIPLPSDEEEAGRILSGLVKPSPLQCDCSGKHSGMLATCLHLGYPIESYLEPGHPVQQTIHSVVAEMCRVDADDLRPATDGCSVPTFGTRLRVFATAYASLASPEHIPDGAGSRHRDALSRLRSAMTSHPENVSGKDSLVTNLMTVSKGAIVAKTGAEGLICLAIPESRLGLAIRIADGSFRAHDVVVPAVLRQLDAVESCMIDEIVKLHNPAIRNHNGIHVGDLRATFDLRFN
jgi:L-asparaginase II